MNRKGTEKPIEIFVALFIILAVALVMLKLFQSQIAEKQKELADVQQEQQGAEMLQKVRQACSDKCVDASNNGCSPASLAALCAYNSENVLGDGSFIDLNKDKTKDYDSTHLGGIGVCEDRVFCFNNLVSSCCNQAITAETCKGILRDYWNGKISNPEIANMLNTTNSSSILYAGACTKDAKRWDQLSSFTSVSVTP